MNKRDLTAARLDAQEICPYRGGVNASSPIMVWGRQGWDSTPFQEAGFTPASLARWLFSQGGCPARLAEVRDDGSATVYLVIEEEGEEIEVEEDEEVEFEDEFVLALKGRGDTFCGSNIQESADWMDQGVWDAGVASELKEKGVTPDQVGQLDEDQALDYPTNGHGLGYALANRNIAVTEVLEALEEL